MWLCDVRSLKRATLCLVLLCLLQLLLLNYVLLCDPQDAGPQGVPVRFARRELQPTLSTARASQRAEEIAQWLAKMAPSIERTAPQPACSPAGEAHSGDSHTTSILAIGSLDLTAADGQLPSLALANVMDGIAPTDIMLSTLVSPLSDQSNASLSVLRLLGRKGLRYVSVATEHFYSKGNGGVMATKQALEAVALQWLGVTSKQSEVVVVGGVRIGLLAFCGVHGKCEESASLPFAPAKYNSKAASSAVSALKERGADVVVVLIRWGREGSYFPDETALVIARHLTLLGVTLIIGSHPQLQQDHAYFGETLILFSAGSFLRPSTDSQLCWHQAGDGERQFSDSDHCMRVHPQLRSSLLGSEQHTTLYRIQLSRFAVNGTSSGSRTATICIMTPPRSAPAVAEYTTLPLKQSGGFDTPASPDISGVQWTQVCGEQDNHCLACDRF